MQMNYENELYENQLMPSRAASISSETKNENKFICNLILDDGMCFDNKLK